MRARLCVVVEGATLPHHPEAVLRAEVVLRAVLRGMSRYLLWLTSLLGLGGPIAMCVSLFGGGFLDP